MTIIYRPYSNYPRGSSIIDLSELSRRHPDSGRKTSQLLAAAQA